MLKIGWNDGHTLRGAGTGAVGVIKETDRNRRIGSKARKILLDEYENIQIINCTIDESSNDMADAVRIANDNKCDAFVSNHVNAGGGKGFETFYSRKSTQSNINRARIIHNRLVKTKSCLADRRCTDDFSYKGYDFYVLINTVMEAYLFEIGFVDNQECVNAINDDEVARAYAEGIAEAYGLKKRTIQTEGWKQNNTGWWYEFADGTYPTSKWLLVKDKWYYFDENGYAYADKWLRYKDKWYYFYPNDNCSMVVNTTYKIKDKYYAFNREGIMMENCKLTIDINEKGELVI